MNQKLFIATIVVAGLFVGALKGQEARNRWVSKMRTRDESRKPKTEKSSDEVMLDDYEIASFHKM